MPTRDMALIAGEKDFRMKAYRVKTEVLCPP